MGGKSLPHGRGKSGIQVYLVAQLAGIAGAAHADTGSVPLHYLVIEVAQCLEGSAEHSLHDLQRSRTLHVDFARGVRNILQHRPSGKMPGQPRKVTGLTRAIDHQHVVVLAQAVDDEVINDAALIVGQKAVAALARGQRIQILRYQGVQGILGARAGERELSHMADVENSAILAGVIMLDDNAFVLDRHFEPGKRGHLGFVGLVPAG